MAESTGNGVASEKAVATAPLDLLELVQRQLLIVRDAAETGLLLVQAMRQGRVDDAGLAELEDRLAQAAPATFMSPKSGGEKA